MEAQQLGFVHRFVPGPDSNGPTLLLLHGTGGNEHDLLGLGKMLLPDAALLSPRGKVLEHGMPRFFRRLAEGVFDEKDLLARTTELAEFVRKAIEAYKLNGNAIVAVGFSNGANIAASMFLLEPDVLRAGVLLRAMVPLQPPELPDLHGKAVFISAGRTDPMIPAPNADRLATMLREAGADVTLAWSPGGHNLTEEDVDVARRWLTQRPEIRASN